VPIDLRAAASWFASVAKGDDFGKIQLRELAVEGVREASAALYRLGEDAPLHAKDAAAVAAGRCPLGDLAAQQAAVDSWGRRSLADIRAAAEGGELSAQLVLGLRTGAKGSPRDAAQALVWLRRAASGNSAHAQAALGAAHPGGVLGVAADGAEAARWLARAAAQGDADSKKRLLELAGAGEPEAVAAARRYPGGKQ
jgi:TPR repeat protein